uniref:BTB domain-containing protein n=1 Tax=Chromera velia CCMP2878 TaxID=1169474 RepID=A0A0G4HCC5_9ALVE|eukprot:Cvel_26160.t1-p1 / transcript=Cvel_26160.t1 / gene=Cvel_26160 / organism=Chromera_velia_CCMP2878 / gene_product=Leucine-zipper-like transcriptional regulator 1, putative / transcript_product=Leucine-zipper-like transcriptional regulator 1, putative / location=Cvel_scaffold3070:5317-14736(+) / protein_length=618 / sequence_SO=supercontig / SO=protein_coding / is_pseudo=false
MAGNSQDALPLRVWRDVVATGSPPCRRSLHVAVTLREHMYVFGGYDGGSRVNDFFRYDFKARKWENLTPTNTHDYPNARDRHVAVAHERRNCIYLFGGYDGNSRVSDFWQYDAEKNEWSILWRDPSEGVGPSARHSHSGIVFEDSVYIFAGYDGNYRNDLWQYDLDTKRWSQQDFSHLTQRDMTQSLPRARYRTSASCWRDRMLVFGGHDGQRHLDDFWEFNLSSRVWTQIVYDSSGGSPPMARDSHAAVVLGDSLYLFGGSTGIARNDLFHFLIKPPPANNPEEPVTGDWTKVKIGAIHSTAHVGAGAGTPLRDGRGSGPASDAGSLGTDRPSTAPAPADRLALLQQAYSNEGMSDTHRLPTDRPAGSGWIGLTSGGGGNSARSGESAAQGATGSGSFQVAARFCHTGVVWRTSLFVFGGYDGQTRLNDFKQVRLEEETLVEIPPSTILGDLKEFLDSGDFADVEFVVDGEVIRAHKMVCARCSYFRTLFLGGFAESTKKRVEIQLCSKEVFKSLLQYLYTDNLEIPLDQAMDVFVAADQFGIDRLKVLCESRILKSIDVENAASILQAADQHNAVGLRSRCLDFLLRNFDQVSRTESFEQMAKANVNLVIEVLRKR